MPRYVTRVTVWFNSEGASPSQVLTKLTELGFKPVRGSYDFIYEHEDDLNDKNLGSAILEISNALHKTLSGFKVLYNLDTHPVEDYVPLEDIDAELAETRKELEEIEKGEKE
jgi:hypothetical protein